MRYWIAAAFLSGALLAGCDNDACPSGKVCVDASPSPKPSVDTNNSYGAEFLGTIEGCNVYVLDYRSKAVICPQSSAQETEDHGVKPAVHSSTTTVRK